MGAPELCTRLTLINARGLHARASAKFIAVVNSYDVHVTVQSHNDAYEDKVVADSIMELLMLGAACGEDITICARGVEASAALAALTQLAQNRFHDEEEAAPNSENKGP
ncbi:MAG: HPr family phosphocarrier protein [Robiginitomaculum sp.]